MISVLLVAEGTSDVRRVRFLLDAWLERMVDWFDPAAPEVVREWVGLGPDQDWFDIHKVHRQFRLEGFPPMFGAPFGERDTPALRKIRLILDKRNAWPDILLWMRDIDTDPLRRTHAIDFVRDLPGALRERYLLAFADQCSEAWVLSGWRADTDDQLRAAAQVQQTTNLIFPRDAHRANHRHSHGGAEWCVTTLGLDTPEAEAAALLRGWVHDGDASGLRDFARALDSHGGLRAALGLPPRSS